ncbi:MAG: glycosyltransferase [Chitinophagaceae bacterium]|nr:glycosyltransferase [Chitinophagaceae bacterium]
MKIITPKSATNTEKPETVGLQAGGYKTRELIKDPKRIMYVFVFVAWLICLVWFEPRLMQLLAMANNISGWIALMLLIVFINIAWLYGLYNISIVLFSIYYRKIRKTILPAIPLTSTPAVALLYTTCNDFAEKSVLSCVKQDYPRYTVYILDDSSDKNSMAQVDHFASQNPEIVKVIRRSNRHAFKAGNLNHALAMLDEKYFAIADADEILPVNFLSKTVPVLEANDNCGFVQANHRANPDTNSKLSKALGIGIDIHWQWYQPLRNDYGFVMFLGHGAVLRKTCWEQIGGFPEIVSEDLGFAIRIRELGYRGFFQEDVICYEDFPETVRAFRVRHMKWTRGTCEFLSKEFRRLIKAKKITWQEKMDILFPTLNLPLTLLFFCFMINANLILPYLFGVKQPITFVSGGEEHVMNIIRMNSGFSVINSLDFYIITMLTFVSPVLCFVIALAHKPIKLFRFLSHSTALYAALSPLSSIGVIGYFFTGKASFLVTGEKHNSNLAPLVLRSEIIPVPFKKSIHNFLSKSHPDQKSIQFFEISTGIIFGIVSVFMFQISFLGLCLAFILLPVLHRLGWDNLVMRVAVYVPFVLILLGLVLSSLNMIGMQSSFFGYGFHF